MRELKLLNLRNEKGERKKACWVVVVGHGVFNHHARLEKKEPRETTTQASASSTGIRVTKNFTVARAEQSLC